MLQMNVSINLLLINKWKSVSNFEVIDIYLGLSEFDKNTVSCLEMFTI